MAGLKVISWNMNRNNDIFTVAKVILSGEPDVVLLQEFPLRRLEALRNYIHPLLPFNIMGNRNIILSNHYIKKVSRIDFGHNKGCLAGKIIWYDSELLLLTTHLHNKIEQKRLHSLYTMCCSLMPEICAGTPMIWGGDFNSVSLLDHDLIEWFKLDEEYQKRSYEPLQFALTTTMNEMGFTDCWISKGMPTPYDTSVHTTRVDYLYSLRVNCTYFKHLDYHDSDHRPILGIFDLSPTVVREGSGIERSAYWTHQIETIDYRMLLLQLDPVSYLNEKTPVGVRTPAPTLVSLRGELYVEIGGGCSKVKMKVNSELEGKRKHAISEIIRQGWIP